MAKAFFRKSKTPATPTDNGLVAAFVLDGDGGARSVDWSEIKSWDPSKGQLWVHLDREAGDVRTWIRKSANLDPIIADILLAADTRPRTLAMESGVLTVLRGVNFNAGSDPEDMVAIRIWSEPHRVITTRHRKLMAVDDLREAFSQHTGPRDAFGVFLWLGERIVSRIGSVVAELDDKIADMEDRVLTEATPDLREKLSLVRRRAIAIRRYMTPQRDALSALQTLEHQIVDAGDRLRLHEMVDINTRHIEDLDSVRERAVVVQDEIMTLASERQNRNSYILAVIAGLVLPLTVVTSLFGVNIGGMYEGGFGREFWALCAALGVMGLLELAVFKALKWI